MPLHLPDLGLTLLALAPAGVAACLFGNWLRRATGRDAAPAATGRPAGRS